MGKDAGAVKGKKAPAGAKFQRGKSVNLKGLTDKKLKTKLKRQEKWSKASQQEAAKAEILLTGDAGCLEAEGMESTFKFTQHQLRDIVEEQTQRKMFDLNLSTFAPYRLDYTRNGRHMLLGGQKGHLALLDWGRNKIVTEFHVKETVHDVCTLHNWSMFAAAQKKYTYVYNNKGVELHRVKSFQEMYRLEFLPYHFLLVGVGRAGYVKWLDTSTGQLVAEHRTKLGPCSVMTHNRRNAVTHLGHSSGTVTLWAPNMSTPLVKVLCHPGAVTAVAVDSTGDHMVTAGTDGRMKVWDLRTYKLLHNHFTPHPATGLTFSQRDVLAVSFSASIQLWKDIAGTDKQKSPYMNHTVKGALTSDMVFCPYEDILGVGTTTGVSSVLVPGAGEPNFDSYEANPFETRKQRREMEVQNLLDKLRPEMIGLDASAIGTVDRTPKDVIMAERAAENEERDKKFQEKRKKRARKHKVKQANVWDKKRQQVQQLKMKEKMQKEKQKDKEKGVESVALGRFVPKVVD
eukprot:CAMPEP_0177638632 /NCGR_PEP_ID=MMETSP0447-20121125/5594_1 /TAXON_ID=0 /ORGANISM="Stygamoeba regulata, Strain BSH-02190019" /LENGTH=513 /DNA_ID=CAMNT_0019140611 /DNA_START=165 /DNA_END=1706 /DNA_ORIENTATION=+